MMITTSVTHMEWDEPPRANSNGLTVGWVLSLGVHVVGLTVLLLWLKATPSVPVASAVTVTLTMQAPVPAVEPKPAVEQVAPLEPSTLTNKVVDAEVVNPPIANTVAVETSDAKKNVPETDVITTGESGLFRYENQVSVSPEQALRAAGRTSAHPSAAFDPRINQQRKEAQRLANLAPAIRAETIKTEQTIAGQTLVRSETGCAVLLESAGSDRLDGPHWAFASCGDKSSSDQFADRLRETMTNRGGR